MKKPQSRRGDYKVGKGRPPDEYKFKPGHTGNKKGRPKGSKNASTMAKAELNRKIIVTINGQKRTMTVVQVAYRRLGDKATAGDIKALNYLLTLANNVDPADIDTAAESVTTEQDLQIIAEYIKRQNKKGGTK